MKNRPWGAVWILAGLWLVSGVAAFLAGRKVGGPTARTVPSTVAAISDLAGGADFGTPERAGDGAAIVSAHPRRTAASYGYRNLVFTPELGEELIRLTELGGTDYIASYVGLDELTCSMGPEAVKAALVFLKERGLFEEQEPGAAGHMSFRLGMLLGEEGVEFARSLGADVDNTVLGWCQTDPVAGLNWVRAFLGASADNALGFKEEEYWKWAIESHPEACLDLYVQGLEVGSEGHRSGAIANEIAAIGTRLGRWDLLEAHAETLIGPANDFRWGLANALADRRAQVDPWGALKNAAEASPGPWQATLSQSAYEVLAEREPVALLNHLIAEYGDDPSGFGSASSAVVGLVSHLSEAALAQALTNENLPSAMRGALTLGFLETVQERGDSHELLGSIDKLEMPGVMRQKIASALAVSWLDEDPEAARAQLYAAGDISPAVIAMVRAGRPTWEVRLMLEDSIANDVLTAEEREELARFFGVGGE